jgi:hypothetical protein
LKNLSAKDSDDVFKSLMDVLNSCAKVKSGDQVFD